MSCADSVDSRLAGLAEPVLACSARQGAPGWGILSLSGALAYAFARTCCSALQRYCILLFIATCRRIFFLLPHFLLYSLLQMRHSRNFVPDAHMRPAIVIEMYVATYCISCVPDVIETASRMATFRLNNSVDTFRNGIVGGFVVFRHTDGNAMFLKKCHVWVATCLLYTSQSPRD